ncbi:PLP-dependent aminotransferase family protein [Arthrobacter sp. zg-Y820]|uniref:aminotransferase-like domain-containing protein n=1 Tax=unclassified Arthrobacter TaxID=235627 RepID=UPI001E551106|nr:MULTISPECIES: PLP-dependent aminotransferase family protein [unclassified Arthrobacter]MCC9197239.1 PLP-dependent aminotransferase family protein [Arthrobacter sp. zg-Y820]MDK1280104.1 PLP-dependent aminotransferase family protein [Arthrobacter sp. zg.Y820]WIB09397.1 PLP-dependent aminotransferase family protein [Arthrobacter sp. zg-Y820]
MTFEETSATALNAETQTALERAVASTHRHEALFSDRAFHIKQSAVRDVFDISIRPGLVSLAGGSPYLRSLPLKELGESARSIIADHGLESLQYGAGQGMAELRRQACEVMAAEGIPDADPDDVVITTGSQSAQDVAAKVFCNPGDVVLCEDPTYVGALNAFEAYEVDVHAVPTDSEGLVPEALEQKIAALRGQGKSIKMLYTIPSFNNPSGVTLAAGRRQRIVDICADANILILEDNPYGMLRFDGRPLTPLRAGNPHDVLYLGSFSKIFAPGVRVGWALVPKHLHRRFYLACEAVVLCPSPLTQMLVSAYLRDYDWMQHIRNSRVLYAARCAAMLSALSEHLPDGVNWTVPDGGFFVWLSLPEGVDTYPLLYEAIDAGVVFIPGAAFTPSDEPSNKLRLAFSAVSEEDIREGVRRLAPVLRRALDAAAG